ncbi:hypothetical protein [Anaerospora sp.]|uniref:hypothetical protein n=1 Tax=Anaerospora sp. TaxID=1960278 RepID=UPI00289BA92D|nr:hypothetical protein [Anaerospora sp.]
MLSNVKTDGHFCASLYKGNGLRIGLITIRYKCHACPGKSSFITTYGGDGNEYEGAHAIYG